MLWATDNEIKQLLVRYPNIVNSKGVPKRFSNFTFELYDDNKSHVEFLRLLRASSQYEYIIIHHDKDLRTQKYQTMVYSDGESSDVVGMTYEDELYGFSDGEQYIDGNDMYKKPHWHCIIHYHSQHTIQSFVKEFGRYKVKFPKNSEGCYVSDLNSMIAYFTHDTIRAKSEFKHSYSWDELIYTDYFESIVHSLRASFESGSGVPTVSAFINCVRQAVNHRNWSRNDARIWVASQGFSDYVSKSGNAFFNSVYDDACKEYKIDNIYADGFQAIEDLFNGYARDYSLLHLQTMFNDLWHKCYNPHLAYRLGGEYCSKPLFKNDLFKVCQELLNVYIDKRSYDLDVPLALRYKQLDGYLGRLLDVVFVNSMDCLLKELRKSCNNNEVVVIRQYITKNIKYLED